MAGCKVQTAFRPCIFPSTRGPSVFCVKIASLDLCQIKRLAVGHYDGSNSSIKSCISVVRYQEEARMKCRVSPCLSFGLAVAAAELISVGHAFAIVDAPLPIAN